MGLAKIDTWSLKILINIIGHVIWPWKIWVFRESISFSELVIRIEPSRSIALNFPCAELWELKPGLPLHVQCTRCWTYTHIWQIQGFQLQVLKDRNMIWIKFFKDRSDLSSRTCLCHPLWWQILKKPHNLCQTVNTLVLRMVWEWQRKIGP